MSSRAIFPSKPNNFNSYRFTIGWEQKNGVRQKRQFNLGTDRRVALKKFNALHEWWEHEVPGDEATKVWTADLIQSCLNTLDAAPVATVVVEPTPQPVYQPVAPTQTPLQKGLTFYDGLRLYLDKCLAVNEKCGEMTRRRYLDSVEEVNRVMKGIADFALAELTSPQIIKERLNMPWAMRPQIVVKGPKGEPKRYKKMGYHRAKELVQRSASALKWLDENNHWIAPRHFEKGLEPPSMTKEELRALDKIPNWELEDVKTLHKYAPAFDKFLIQCGVFLGWTQKEIATLRRDELVERDGELFIDKRRSKTGIKGFWWVMPELARTMRELAGEQTKRNPIYNGTDINTADLLVVTPDGHPLVREHPINGTHVDAVGLRWSKMQKFAKAKGIQPLSFKTFRKYALDVMQNIGGHEMSLVFAAQTLGEDGGKDVNEKYYTSRGARVGVGKSLFEQMNDAQRKMYEELRPHFFPVKQAVTEKEAA